MHCYFSVSFIETMKQEVALKMQTEPDRAEKTKLENPRVRVIINSKLCVCHFSNNLLSPVIYTWVYVCCFPCFNCNILLQMLLIFYSYSSYDFDVCISVRLKLRTLLFSRNEVSNGAELNWLDVCQMVFT